MIKVLSIIGTRPEAIKMAPVIKELEKHPEKIISRVCVTAQHREMLDQVLELFEIIPDYDLDLMQEGQTLSGLTARVFTALDPVLEKEKPDWVLVQGDTTTVMAASLAAFYHQIKVGHVEAGLRTGDKWQPFPEEVNRKIAGVVADLHFAPTETARDNLLAEGVDPETIHVTGNPVIDALHMTADMPFDLQNSSLAGIPWKKKIILVTAHRRENFGRPLENICAALKEIANQYRDEVYLVYPVHPNPNVLEKVYPELEGIPNISLIEPLNYLPLVQLMKRTYMVVTDSGGLQEEAPGLGKPVLVLRKKTERPEGIDAETAKLIGTGEISVFDSISQLIVENNIYKKMSSAINPYGDGYAAKRIIELIINNPELKSNKRLL